MLGRLAHGQWECRAAVQALRAVTINQFHGLLQSVGCERELEIRLRSTCGRQGHKCLIKLTKRLVEPVSCFRISATGRRRSGLLLSAINFTSLGKAISSCSTGDVKWTPEIGPNVKV